MKKIIFTTFIILISINIFAQTVKPCLFIASTSIKNSICSDYKWVQEEVKDYQEYDQKRKQYREDNTLNSYAGIGGGFVKATECAIVYEFKAKRSGFNCSPITQSFIKGPTIENCEEQLKSVVEKSPNYYTTQPKIIFRWCGKGIVLIDNPMEEQTSGAGATSGGGGNTSTNNNRPCPTYGFKFNAPSYNCVALEWWSLSNKTNSVDAAGNFKQSNDPEAKSFTIDFRKLGDISWTSERRDNTGRNVHTLNGLDACTQYEVRLTATCNNNVVSIPSNIVRFTTACTKPGNLSVENITNNSAKVSSQRLTALFTSPCSSSAKTQVRIVEYKTSTSNWQDVICNSGSPCILNALQSATIYRVRARYKYGNNLYSVYTNEVSFTTGQ